MAWPTLRTFKDAAAVTRQAITGTTATAGEDKPLYNPVYGPDGADPAVVTLYAGLPVQPARLSGAPTTYARVATSSAAVTGNGNVVAIGGTGGSAVPGVFVVQAAPDNTAVAYIGDSNASAFLGEVRGIALQPGDSQVVGTDDLRAWKLSTRVSGNAVTVTKVL